MGETDIAKLLEEEQGPSEHEERRRAAEIVIAVKQVLDAERFVPPILPEVAIALQQLAGTSNVDIATVESTVARDPAIAARVLSVVNSPLFSRGVKVTSLRAALMRLGLSEVRNIAFEVVAQTSLFRVPGYDTRMRALFDEAQAVGTIAREICRTLQFESELAYLCGLLHDMGEAIVLGIVGDTARLRHESPPSLEDLQRTLSDYHAQVGAHVCRRWELPESISDAILHHHRPEASRDPSQMATVVAVADRLTRHAGLVQPQLEVDPGCEPLFYRLMLTPEQVRGLIDFVESLASASADD